MSTSLCLSLIDLGTSEDHIGLVLPFGRLSRMVVYAVVKYGAFEVGAVMFLLKRCNEKCCPQHGFQLFFTFS